MPSDDPAEPSSAPQREAATDPGTGSPETSRFAGPRRLHPASVLLGLNLRQVVEVLLFPAAASPGGARTAVVVFAIVGTAGMVLRVLAWWHFRYSFDGEVLRVDEGVLSRNDRALRVERIQQVEVDRSFVQRLFGLAALRIETAGVSGEIEAELRLLTEEEAWALHDGVLAGKARASRARTAGMAGAEESASLDPRRREILRVPLGHVVLASITGARLLVFPAVIGGMFEFAGQYLEGWFQTAAGQLRGPGLEIDEELVQAPFAVGVVAAAAVLGLSVVTAVVVGVLRDANFRIVQVEEDLRVSRGLLSIRDSALPLRRIQLVQVQRNWLRRLIGYAAVRVYSAGGSAHADRQVTIPLLPTAGVDAVVREVYPGVAGLPELSAHPGPALRRAIVRWLAAAAVLVMAVWVLPFTWLEPLRVPVLVVLPAAIALGIVEYRQLAHGASEVLVASRRGVVTTTTSLAPLVKIQAVTTRSNWFQRRLDLATVRVHVAGPGGDVEVLDAGTAGARDLHARLIEHSADPVPAGPRER